MPTLAAAINAADGNNWTAYNGGRNSAALVITAGNAGFALNYMSGVDAILGSIPTRDHARVVALINFGANDYCCGLPSQATWEATATDLVDRVRNRWPQAEVHFEYPWTRGYDSQANTFATWIDDIRAARALGTGPDERVWMKGADDGATMSSDGTHYSAAGDTEHSAQWFAVIHP